MLIADLGGVAGFFFSFFFSEKEIIPKSKYASTCIWIHKWKNYIARQVQALCSTTNLHKIFILEICVLLIVHLWSQMTPINHEFKTHITIFHEASNITIGIREISVGVLVDFKNHPHSQTKLLLCRNIKLLCYYLWRISQISTLCNLV